MNIRNIIHMNCGRDRYEDMIDHVFISPQFKYMIFRIPLHFSPSSGIRWYQLPDGLIAQLVEQCTGIAEVMGSNPVQV